jgi:hypothetical protein
MREPHVQTCTVSALNSRHKGSSGATRSGFDLTFNLIANFNAFRFKFGANGVVTLRQDGFLGAV